MCAAKVLKIKKNLDLPAGQWQLFSYGQLTAVPTAKQAIWIKGFFRRVVLNDRFEITSWGKETVCRELPVGELVAWEIGCIFDSETHRIRSPQAIGEGFKVVPAIDVEFTRENCTLIRRHDYLNGDEEQFVLRNPGIKKGTLDSNTYFLIVARGAQPPLLIPCTTVLQTFWARSSNFLHMLLDSRFLDFDRYVINVEKSRLDTETGQAHLWLRQWSIDADARFLATIAFDAEAIQRGREISARLHSTVAEYGDQVVDRYVAALPPYEKPMQLRAQVRSISTSVGEMLFVQRILSSTYAPPFTELIFDRDNDGRPQEPSIGSDGQPASFNPREPIKRPQSFKPRDEGETDFELANDHPGYAGIADTLDVGKFDTIFENITNKVATKLPQLELNFEGDSDPYFSGDDRWNGLISTLPSSSVSSVNALGAVLTSGRVISDEFDESKTPIGPYLNSFLDKYFKALPLADPDYFPDGVYRISLEPVFPWQANRIYDPSLTFSLPSEHEDAEWAWLYYDPASLARKRAVCFKVSFYSNSAKSVGYILDVEGRNAKSKSTAVIKGTASFVGTPMLFFWRHPEESETEVGYAGFGSNLSLNFLRDLVIELVRESGSKAVTFAESRSVHAVARKHSVEGVEMQKLLAELYSRCDVSTDFLGRFGDGSIYQLES